MHNTWLTVGSIVRASAVVAALGWFGCVGGLPASAESAHATSAPKEPATEDSAESKSAGLELGEYEVRVYYPVESQRGKISFTLYATVTGDNLADAERALEHRRNKVRDQVIIATRLVPLADLNDPELENFRRRILLRLHRALPELAIDSVYVSDFDMAVQSM